MFCNWHRTGLNRSHANADHITVTQQPNMFTGYENYWSSLWPIYVINVKTCL